MNVGAPHNTEARICDEDLARAEVYALISTLLYQAPSNELLGAIASSNSLCNDDSVTEFCRAWRALQQAAARGDSDRIKDEFDTAFIGTGRQPVMLYGSFYVTGFLHDKPLARLREQLTQMSVKRQNGRHESEDHISALCDVMRFLIAGNSEALPASIDAQRQFFRQHIEQWYPQLCAAIDTATETQFYKHVANFMREFFVIEDAAFDIA